MAIEQIQQHGKMFGMMDEDVEEMIREYVDMDVIIKNEEGTSIQFVE